MADIETLRRIHIVGVAGAGMSALAKILAGRGHDVSGSDLRGGSALAGLGDLGIPVWPGHRPEKVADLDLVVASSAVPDSDEELIAARRSGVEVWRRPQLLRAITAMTPTIGATGTHGKTTSTGMLIAASRAVGLDPSFVVGGELVEYRTNAIVGTDDLLVLEVDEAFGTFEHVRLSGLMVTNVESDHLDHFGTLEQLEEAFVRVVKAVDGPAIVCSDDAGGARLAAETGAMTYGTVGGGDRHWAVHAIDNGRFVLNRNGTRVEVTAPRRGHHMMLNAAGVVALMAELGHDPEQAAGGVATYQGVGRRFERKGIVAGVTVIDDYAHHPTEIIATLTEARLGTTSRLVAVFQPHLYSRTARLKDAFGVSLALADVVFVTDVYGSRESPQPGVTGALVAEATQRAGCSDVRYVPHMTDIPARVVPILEGGDVVVVLGAGDITVIGPEILIALDEQRSA